MENKGKIFGGQDLLERGLNNFTYVVTTYQNMFSNPLATYVIQMLSNIMVDYSIMSKLVSRTHICPLHAQTTQLDPINAWRGIT